MRWMRQYGMGAVALTLALSSLPCRAQDPLLGEVITIGADLRVHAMLPSMSGAPHHSVILLSGGNGVLNLNQAGEVRDLEGNFLIRAAGLFRNQFFNVAILDAGPAPVASSGLTNQRLSQAHADFIGQAIAVARAKWPGTAVWLIGTSNGTLSVVNGAARLTGGALPNAIVLTSAVTQSNPSGELGTVLAANPGLANITIPTFVVWASNDTCSVSPAASAQSVFDGLTQLTPRRKSSHAFAGSYRNPAVSSCGAFAPHGYNGIETQVIDSIAQFMARFP